MYLLKISYYDVESDYEEYETRDEAMDAFSTAIDQREQMGMSFGDTLRIAVINRTGDKSKVIAAKDYD